MKNNLVQKTKIAQEFFLQKISFEMSPFELNEKIKTDLNDINIVDVRNYEDYLEGHIPFAIHIPYESFEEHLKMLNKDKINVFYCYNPYCLLGAKAAFKAAEWKYPAKELLGGFSTWKKLNYDIVKTVQ